MMGNTFAQSNLPACQGTNFRNWTNCYGTIVYNNSNGHKFVGEWKDGKRHGQGTETFANGDKYLNVWKDGKDNGQGTLYSANGSIINQGIWADGKLIRSESAQRENVSNAINSVAISLSSRLTPAVQAEDSSKENRISVLIQEKISSVCRGYCRQQVFINLLNNKAILYGNVTNPELKIEIETLVKKESDVRVHNLINVSEDIYSQHKINLDNFLMESITSSIDSRFPVSSTKIFVYENIVYLMGVVTSLESEYLKKLVSQMPNVKAVYAFFDIISMPQADRLAQQFILPNKEREKLRADAEETKRKQAEQEQLRLSQNQIPAPPILSTSPPVTAPFMGKRLALVIGNASYKVRPLLNPRNDADDVSRVLRSTGFEVIDLRDATLAQMRTSVRQFGERLMSNDVGLVYYSGHGIEVKGRNYFIPVNADIKASDEVADQALDVSLILAKMDTAKKGVNILIVDACRDDPFGRSFRSNSRGLATMDAPQGTLIAYATAPGSVAADGTGRNSPFTKHLVRAMQVPNTPIELMFKEVRRAVREETKNQQTPWENSSLIGNFYFSVKK
jgi:osmotically-inducible protein OsmY